VNVKKLKRGKFLYGIEFNGVEMLDEKKIRRLKFFFRSKREEVTGGQNII
jgi:hypothetical protein